LGGALADLGTKWLLEEADTQFTQAKSLARMEHDSFMLSLRDVEPSEYGKAYQESIKKRKAFEPKNNIAAKEYDKWLTLLNPFWIKDTIGAKDAKIEDNGRAAGFVLQQQAIETGRMREYNIHLEKGVKFEWYSQEEKEKLKQSTIDQRKRFLNAQAIQARARQKEEFDKYVNLTQDAWLDNLRNDVLTENQIRNSTVPVDIKSQWLSRLDKRNEAILKGQEKETVVTQKMQGRQLAMDTREGIVSPGEFRQWQADALADGMEDIDYEEVSELFQREFRAGQIETIQGRITANKSQLVDLPSEISLTERLRGLSEEAKADILSLRKLQLDNWDRYSKALTDYQKEKPEAGIEELYDYGQKLITQYKKTPDELRASFRLRSATRKHGQRELKKAKAVLEGAKDQRVEHLRFTFNLSPEEVRTVEDLLSKGVSIGDITLHLQGKAK
jgi:hypothetical protein